MDGERKKRKMKNIDEEEEEEKMEKFFQLIKSTREFRNHLSGDKGISKKVEVGVWNPSFKQQDFIKDVGVKGATPTVEATSSSKRDDDSKGGNSLDLNLSL